MDITLILRTNYPNAEWSLRGDDYDGLEWLDSSPKPTLEELESLWLSTQIEARTKVVEEIRQIQYQKIADPIFFKWQAGSSTKEEWLSERQRIKDENPYPDGVAD